MTGPNVSEPDYNDHHGIDAGDITDAMVAEATRLDLAALTDAAIKAGFIAPSKAYANPATRP